MPKSIDAAVLNPDQHDLQIQQLQLADPRDNEVLVKIVATGICHTDMVLREYKSAPPPVVLGHEGAGIIEQVGAGVRNFQVGDRVGISFAFCGECYYCKKNAPSYCQNFLQLNFFGGRADGSCCLSKNGETVRSHVFGQSSFATHAVCSTNNLVKVDEGIPLEIVGPFGCGFQTGAGAVLNTLRVTAGASVLVLGAGAVGLAAVAAARHIAGAEKVIAVDLQDSRLQLAQQVGATHSIKGDVQDFDAAVRALCPLGVDYALDTTGYVPLVEAGVKLLVAQGSIALVASYPPGVMLNVDMLSMQLTGIRIMGSTEGDSDVRSFIPLLLDHYRAGRFPVDKLVRYYDLKDINTAIADSESGETVKAIVRMP